MLTSIINSHSAPMLAGLALLLVIFSGVISGHALTSVAISAPDGTVESRGFAQALGEALKTRWKIQDADMTQAAFVTIKLPDPFNLSIEEAVRIGEVIGCNYFILIKAATLRRNSLERNDYYESFGIVYLVSSRTGSLIFWTIEKRENDDPRMSRHQLHSAIERLAFSINARIEQADKVGAVATRKVFMETPQPETEKAAKDRRPPIPYSRIKPQYTRLAYLYDAKGTVDVEVDIDEKGNVSRTEIVRWLGYGLDESVLEAVRRMNWRPAERGGKFLPMRVLLRYNFKKIEID